MGLTRNYDNILAVSQLPNIGFTILDQNSNNLEDIAMTNDQLYLLDQNGIDFCRIYPTGANLFNNMTCANNGATLSVEYYGGSTSDYPPYKVHSNYSNLEFGSSVDPEDYDDFKMQIYDSNYATASQHWSTIPEYNPEDDTWTSTYRKRYIINKPMKITEIGIYRASTKRDDSAGKVLLYRKRLITEEEIQDMLAEGKISQGDIDTGKIKPEAIIFTSEDINKAFDITFTATTGAHPHFTTSVALVNETEEV